jgi:hypothetical protein
MNGHREGIQPLLHDAGDRVLVYGEPICADCGRAIKAIGPDRWRHAAAGRPSSRPSKWLSPSINELRACATYEEFAARYPWAVRSNTRSVLAMSLATSRGQWREGMSWLERYRRELAALASRRKLHEGANPYRDLVEILAAPPAEAEDPEELAAMMQQPRYWGLPYGLFQMLGLSERRQELVQLCAWAIPTQQALDTLARYAPLLDCGAGMGYWAALLQTAGVDTIAYDLHPPGNGASNAFHRKRREPWTEVLQAPAVDAVRRHRGRTLMLCWPPYEDDAASYAALRAYRGDIVIHIGERDGASGSVRFHRELALNWTVVEEVDLPHWPRLDDRLRVYRRNLVRRAQLQRDRCDECRRFVPTGSLGRCDACFERHPPALALRSGRHRAEFSHAMLGDLPPALRKAYAASPKRIR